MRLKIKTDSSSFTIPKDMVTTESTLQTLLVVIESLSEIALSSIKSLKLGYPPRQILPSIRNLECSLSVLEIKNGDIITISKDSSEIETSTQNSNTSSRKNVVVDNSVGGSRKRTSRDASPGH